HPLGFFLTQHPSQQRTGVTLTRRDRRTGIPALQGRVFLIETETAFLFIRSVAGIATRLKNGPDVSAKVDGGRSSERAFRRTLGRNSSRRARADQDHGHDGDAAGGTETMREHLHEPIPTRGRRTSPHCCTGTLRITSSVGGTSIV